METEAAVLWERHAEWSVEPIELDPPKEGELVIRLAASGMCHSDEHLVTGDMPVPLPVIGGHEGAGVVEEVGPGVTGLAPGDHVVLGFIPACGKCPSCATGHSNLCDQGATLMSGYQMDGTVRHHARGQDVSTMVCLGTFAKYSVVNQASCVKVLDDVPLDKACLVGCGVTTGWGSAVYAADVRPGDYVAVIGIGGIGAAALQGARLAGAEKIFAIDPVALKRDLAPSFGATHVASSVDEAKALVEQETWGRMCDKVICAMGVGSGAMMQSILDAHRQARPGRRDQHPPDDGARRHDEPHVPDDHGEAGGREHLRVRQHPLGHPEAAQALPRRAARPRLHDHDHLQAR